MKEYHKIQTVFLRDPKTKYKTLLMGQFALPEFEFLAGNTWVFTEKIDGTNIRVIWDEGTLRFEGKSDRAQIPPFLFKALTEIFEVSRLEELFKETPVCLYGEGFGAKIQKGGRNYIKDGQSFVLFDAKIDKWWIKRLDLEHIAQDLSIGIVPIVGYGNLIDMVNLAKEGFNSAWGDFKAEGIVARPQVELFSRNGNRIITKIKYKDFK